MRSRLSAFILGVIVSSAIFAFSAATAQQSKPISIRTHHELPLAIQVAKGQPLLIFAVQIDHELLLSGGEIIGNSAQASLKGADQIDVVAGVPSSSVTISRVPPSASRTTPPLPNEVYTKEIERIVSGYLTSIKSLQDAMGITEQGTIVMNPSRRDQMAGYARLLKTYGKQVKILTPSDRLMPIHTILLDGAEYFDEVADIILVEQASTREQYGRIFDNLEAGVDKISEAVTMLDEMLKALSSDHQ